MQPGHLAGELIHTGVGQTRPCLAVEPGDPGEAGNRQEHEERAGERIDSHDRPGDRAWLGIEDRHRPAGCGGDGHLSCDDQPHRDHGEHACAQQPQQRLDGQQREQPPTCRMSVAGYSVRPRQPPLDDAMAAALAELGNVIAIIQGSPQDIEWAIVGETPWILQARPITATLPQAPQHQPPITQERALHGAVGSPGTVTAAARIVRGPSDFPAAQPGEIIVCPYTDPAWTPLFAIAAGVITETGGVLSHAAIVAREYGIPAILGVPDALRRIRDGQLIELDGAAGTITLL